MRNMLLTIEFEEMAKEILQRKLFKQDNERDLSYCIGRLIMNAESYPANRKVNLFKQVYEEDIILGLCYFTWNYATNEFKFICKDFEFTQMNNIILSALIKSKGEIINKKECRIVIF